MRHVVEDRIARSPRGALLALVVIGTAAAIAAIAIMPLPFESEQVPLAARQLRPEPQESASAEPGSCRSGYVALTFDDGPSPATRRAAEILRREDAPATFFLIGEHVEAYPGVARMLVRRGHKVYNHTYSHPRLTDVSDARIRREIERASAALQQADVPNSRLVRPPFGAFDERVERVIDSAGYNLVKWTWDTEDWREGRTADDIVTSVISGLEPDANYLMHEEEPETIKALPQIISVIRDRGYCLGVVDVEGRVVEGDEA